MTPFDDEDPNYSDDDETDEDGFTRQDWADYEGCVEARAAREDAA